MRRCLFTATVATCEVPFAPRFAGATRVPAIPLGMAFVVAERGLLDAAIFGSPVPPLLRELLPFGVPDARFLRARSIHARSKLVELNLFLMTSVLSDNGRTTPCSFLKTNEDSFVANHQCHTHKEKATGIACRAFVNRASIKDGYGCLQRGCPSGSRLHSGVLVVWQFVQEVGG